MGARTLKRTSASDAADFFAPLCVEHLRERCPEVLPYLVLPPGWSFAIERWGRDPIGPRRAIRTQDL